MRQVAVLTCLLCCVIVGCGAKSDGPPTYPVSGTVTFDGAPLKTGDIRLEPEAAGEAPDSGPITDGKFSLRAKQGQKRVVVTASREVPGKTIKGAMGEDIVVKEQFLPARYNEKTELKATIKSSGNTLTFELKSDEAPK